MPESQEAGKLGRKRKRLRIIDPKSSYLNSKKMEGYP
jgi:hypothetical protein